MIRIETTTVDDSGQCNACLRKLPPEAELLNLTIERKTPRGGSGFMIRLCPDCKDELRRALGEGDEIKRLRTALERARSLISDEWGWPGRDDEVRRPLAAQPAAAESGEDRS